MKLLTKVLTNRLKPCIPDIVDHDQTGFIHGRNIAENFVYAADLLSCCHKRGAPTTVLKLDFRKAFDSVSWDSLDRILAIRRFDARWRGWINSILSSGKTVVMLNGVPGRWMSCKRGLRQGDPISPTSSSAKVGSPRVDTRVTKAPPRQHPAMSGAPVRR